jgi:hypothetical protein
MPTMSFEALSWACRGAKKQDGKRVMLGGGAQPQRDGARQALSLLQCRLASTRVSLQPGCPASLCWKQRPSQGARCPS